MSCFQDINKNSLSGSQCIRELLKFVNGDGYGAEARIWSNSTEQMRYLLWNLANLNSLKHNVQFKKEWLGLPNDVKAALRKAIYELVQFVEYANLCAKKDGRGVQL